MMQFLKENFQLVCLLVGVVGVILSVITLAAEARKKRNYRIHLFPASESKKRNNAVQSETRRNTKTIVNT